MRRELLSLLAAPEGGGPLELTVDRSEGDEIISGILRDDAGRSYPIEDGIPRLLPEKLHASQVSEIAARDAQVEDYDRMAFLNAFGKVEIPLMLRMLKPQRENRLLEAGCGTGRMTRTLAGHAREVVAIDFSFESLRQNARKLKNASVKNVHLVQADLCNLPFRTEAFPQALSCQVLEHVPDHPARERAVRELSRVLAGGSTLVLSAYQHSLFTKMTGSKSGEHDGGIPYFRFEKHELRRVLENGFEVQGITGSLLYLWAAQCRKNPPRLA
jgi:ubiquinone/menaquinone biosynthesis C-methylase UbiE